MSIDEILFVRVSVGDGKVCDDCIRLETLPPANLDWWEQSGQMPREAITACDQKCRCGLVPDAIDDMERRVLDMIEEAVKEGTQQTMIDLTTGRTIRLKDFENIQGLLTVQYERIAYMESLIYQWKVANAGLKLPDEFFKLSDIEKMIKWLEKGAPVVPGIPISPAGMLLTKSQIEEKLNDLGIKDIDLTGINDINVLNDINAQLIKLISQEKYINNFIAIWKYSNGAYAKCKPGIDMSKLVLNEKYFNDHKKIINSFKADMKAGFHPKIRESEIIKFIVTHEYAHSLTSKEIYYKKGLYNQINTIRQEYRNELNSWKGKNLIDCPAFISGYAATDLDEFTAEAFAMYKHSSKPSPFAVKVGKLIDAKYKKGGVQ